MNYHFKKKEKEIFHKTDFILKSMYPFLIYQSIYHIKYDDCQSAEAVEYTDRISAER